jgi:hypothetical protein
VRMGQSPFLFGRWWAERWVEGSGSNSSEYGSAGFGMVPWADCVVLLGF